MVWSEAINFHLLTHSFFQTFTALPIADAKAACGALYAISFDDRAAVDATASAGAAAGGTVEGLSVVDMGWMYNRQIQDPDGNVLELVWMDISAMPQDEAG